MAKSNMLLGYIKASTYRTKIIMVLENKKMTPIEMARETGISLSHVSNTLAELLKNDLAVCLTPKLKKGRLYELTATSKKILKDL